MEDISSPAIAQDARTIAQDATTMPNAIAMAKATTIGLATAIIIPLVVGTAIAITTLNKRKEEKTDDLDAVTATLKMTTLKGNNTILIKR